jgi:hypothetical protein
MSQFKFFLFILITLFGTIRCGKKCICRDLEDCKDGNCVLKPNSFYLAGHGITGNELYWGVVRNNGCVDTIVVENQTPSRYHYLVTSYIPDGQGGFNLLNAVLNREMTISEKEYYLTGTDLICLPGGVFGDNWILRKAHFIDTRDSIQMQGWFRSLFNQPPDREFIDSFKVTLHSLNY